jgi:hypothetical protein
MTSWCNTARIWKTGACSTSAGGGAAWLTEAVAYRSSSTRGGVEDRRCRIAAARLSCWRPYHEPVKGNKNKNNDNINNQTGWLRGTRWILLTTDATLFMTARRVGAGY